MIDKKTALNHLYLIAVSATNDTVPYNPEHYNQLVEYLNRPVPDWQSIDTAPKDRKILLFGGEEYIPHDGWISEGWWCIPGFPDEPFWTDGEMYQGEMLPLCPSHWAERPDIPQ